MAGELGDALAFGVTLGHALTVQLDQFWFVVEEVELGGGTGLEQVNDPFGAGSEMKRVNGMMRCRSLHGTSQKAAIEQGSESNSS